MKIRFLFTFLFISTFVFAQTEALRTAKPESLGMSSKALDKIDAHIKQYIAESKVPGGSFMVVKEGKIVYEKSFGYHTSKNKISYQSSDIYRLASMTKAVTCVAVMQLVEDGKIKLDDPVYQYIPSFKNQVVLDKFTPADSSYTTVPVEKAVTIRNLLTHTSGIIYGSFNPGKLMAVYEKFDMNIGFSHPEWTTEEWIDKLAKVPLAHQPGKQFSYGLSMDVLGRVIEVTSGQTLDQYFQQNIFDKVGMKDTHFYLPESKFSRLAPVYTKAGQKLMALDEIGAASQASYPKEGPRNFFAGGAGLSATTHDYAKFISTLALGGGNLLKPETLAEMTRDQMPDVITDYKNRNSGSSFALGFTLYQDSPNKKSPKSPGTYEWGGYFNTKFFIDPAEEMVFVGMTQIVPFGHNAFWEDMYKLVYEAVDTEH